MGKPNISVAIEELSDTEYNFVNFHEKLPELREGDGHIDTKPTKTNKWSFFFLIKGEHPINKCIFDDEPYNIDTILTFEDHLRFDKNNSPKWKKVVSFIWDPILLPPSERKYVTRIDFFIFIYAIFACFIKYLDQTNINNAYVSGMKEDLNMYGSNDYNLLTTFFNIGYIGFSVPMALLIKHFRPSVILPLSEVTWTIIVMCMALAKSKRTIFILRFFQGVISSSSFPGLTMIIGEFYHSESLAKRMFMLDATGSIASMFAGYIQAGVYGTMNGRYGIPGWKWVFLVDGFISIPVVSIPKKSQFKCHFTNILVTRWILLFTRLS